MFWLHESFANPKVVVKQPPYQVKQSGYAGFNILVDIHFKNKVIMLYNLKFYIHIFCTNLKSEDTHFTKFPVYNPVY